MPRQTTSPKFDDRIRFNWGFHDGANDAEDRRLPREMDSHFDRIYAAGYVDGYRVVLAGQDRSSSEPAWTARLENGEIAPLTKTTKTGATLYRATRPSDGRIVYVSIPENERQFCDRLR